VTAQKPKMRRISTTLRTPWGPKTEYLWGEIVSEDTVKVANIPFFSQVAREFERILRERSSPSTRGAGPLRRASH
jgi:hypothetical protein